MKIKHQAAVAAKARQIMNLLEIAHLKDPISLHDYPCGNATFFLCDS